MKNLLKVYIIVFIAVLAVSCTKDNDEVAPEATSENSNSLKTELAKYLEIKSINEEATLIDIAYGSEDCFSINYPVSFALGDSGDTESVANDEDFIALFNSDVTFLEINYPINATLEDGAQKVLNSEEEYYVQEDVCAEEALESEE
ncbi:hypothetical protein [Aquimarina sp. RZ0]|uniref:hypothetical protein n=1 Tax=Aquimarina sp. RZ0 TaxID=2607730 RepID=UPI0011F0EE97|nr:hypothetical protein [Aquimarina sp. RZ0]KAA1243645.1 hypothetical protein F0000_19995 [Aquimarina sp. RZ0]